MNMTRRPWIATGVAASVLALWALVIWAPPDGRSRSEWLQFIGAFHPLAVHLPIALVLLVPLLELFSQRGSLPNLKPAAGFVLLLAALAATVAPFLGWCLAWSSGYEGGFVTQHMWSGVSLATLCWLCWWLRAQDRSFYKFGLALAVLLVGFTGYRGGQLAHGDNHLTEHMPAALRRALHLPPATATEASTFFGARIAPIFTEHCLLCHSANKHKGGLRLDSYPALMKGGKDGLVVRAGELRSSELFRRITLEPGAKDAMPAEGKPPLSADEIKLIELWIAAGASATLPVDGIAGAPALASGASPSAPDWHSKAQALAALQAELGIRLVPRSQIGTDGVILRTASAPRRCDDATLAKLAPIAPLIVEAELSRTKITDAGLKSLTAFTNMQTLDLSHTAITTAGLAALTPLKTLRKLNLTGTALDASAVARLRARLTLTHFYVFQTQAETDENPTRNNQIIN